MASISELRGRFREVVSTDEELRAVVGEPPSHSVAKVVTAIDRIARTFIEHAPFAFVAPWAKLVGWTFHPEATLPAS